MLELQKLKEHHAYKFLKFKYSIIKDKKLHKVNQLQQHQYGLLDNQLAKQLMEMQEQEVILKFSTLEVINVNKLIMEISIGKLI